MELTAKIEKYLSNDIWYHATNVDDWHNICKTGVLAEYNKDLSDALDFGFGFYLTPSKEAAEMYIYKLNKAIFGHEKAVILGFKFCPKSWFTENIYKTKVLNAYDDEFALFVFENRTENVAGNNQHDYDIIYGVMSDSVPVTIILEYKEGIITKEEALTQLKKSTSMKQLSLHNQEICDMIVLQEAYLLDLNTFDKEELDINEYRKQTDYCLC